MYSSDAPENPTLNWLFLSSIVTILDQSTKAIATAAMDLHQSIPVIPGLQWTLVHNYGVAFSLFNNGEGWQRYGLSAFALIVIVILIAILAQLSEESRAAKFAFTLVIGGAIGNVIDRLRLGYVVDFVDVYVGTLHWPAFNVADSSICFGAAILLIWGWKRKPSLPPPDMPFLGY